MVWSRASLTCPRTDTASSSCGPLYLHESFQEFGKLDPGKLELGSLHRPECLHTSQRGLFTAGAEDEGFLRISSQEPVLGQDGGSVL